jgi:hypothetical protein
MKKIIYLLTILIFGYSASRSQNLNVITQSTVCFNNQGSTTMTAVISNTIQGAAGYSWTVNGFSCVPTYTVSGNGQMVTITYPCCDDYIIAATAYNASLTVMVQGTTGISVICNSVVVAASQTTICAGDSVYLAAGGSNSYTWTGPNGNFSYSSTAMVSPSVSSCYYATGSTNGCIDQNSVCITVLPSPTVSVTGPNTACAGATVSLTANGGSSYIWNTGMSGASITASLNSSTCYSVIGTNAFNCTSMAVHCVTVGAVAQISGPNSVCAGSSVTLTSSAATSYTWLPIGSTSSAVVVSPSTTTCYTLLTSSSCGTAMAVKCLQVNPSPTIGITVSPGCANTRTLTATGGNVYVWSGNLTGGSIVVSPSTTTCYYVTAQNNFNCPGTASICINPQNGGFSVTGPSVVCLGGSATFSATGFGTYTWMPGATIGSSLVITPTVSSCYTVTGTFTNGCTQTIVKCITVSPYPNLFTSNNGVCQGGTGVLSATGAQTYSWIPYNMTGANIVVTSTAASCYTLFGTNAAGCTGSTSGCFTVLPSPTVIATSSVTICPGTSATLTASGATSYTWQPVNYIGANLVVSPNTNFCFTVTGNNGSCSSTTVSCVNVLIAPLTFSGSTSVCVGSSNTILAVGPSSFVWQPGNLTTSSIVVTPTVSSCYTLVATYTNGCVRTAPRCIAVNALPNISTFANTFCSGNSGILTASGGISYTWMPFASTGASVTISPTVSGCYTVTGTNSNGCSRSVSNCYTVLPTPTISISGASVLCAGQTTTLTASGATSYTWMPGIISGANIVISPSTTTCYTVYGYNAGCSSSAVRCVTVQNTSVSITGASTICSGSTATLTANGASGYSWQPGNLTGTNIIVSPLSATCYTLTGINSNGTCVATAVKCLTVVNKPTLSTVTGPFCSGISGTLSASGANSYTWYPYNVNGSMIYITPTVSGCYTVSGSNSSGCIGSVNSCFSVNPTPTITVTGNIFLCAGASTTLTATGANSYTWFPGNITGASLSVSPTANTCYTVIGSTNADCIKAQVVCVSVQTPTLQITGAATACMNSSITLTAAGAVNYLWLPGGMTGSTVAVSPAANTCYTVTGTSPNGSCTSVAVKCVTVASPPVVTATSGTFCAGQAGTLTASGATSYTWYPFNITGPIAVVSPSVSSCFTVVGTDATGCRATAINCYSIMPVPSINVSGNSNVCAGNSTTLTASGATSYTWHPGGSSGSVLITTPTANVCYTVTGSNGFCQSSGLRCITVQQATTSINGPASLCGAGSVTLTVSTPGTFTWQPGNITGAGIVVSPTASTCYSVSGYGSSNCLVSAVKCLNVVNNLQLTISGTQTICAGQLANISVSGASTYSWSNGSNSSSIFVSPPSTTSYFVTGFIGTCATTTAVPVTVYPMPVVSLVSNAPAVCAGSAVQLIANGAGTYTWNWSTGQTGNVIGVTPSVTTVYTVTGTNIQGCSRTATISINVFGNCTGLEDIQGVSDISLYPNPTAGELKMSSSENQKVKFVMFDMLGREISRGEFTGTKTINIAEYNNGSYVVRFEGGGKISHRRLVIDK